MISSVQFLHNKETPNDFKKQNWKKIIKGGLPLGRGVGRVDAVVEKNASVGEVWWGKMFGLSFLYEWNLFLNFIQ